MKKGLIILGVSAFLAVANIGEGFGKIYKNVIENKETKTTTICLYEGENDLYLTPVKQYEIKYSDQGQPVEKVLYVWNAKNKRWALSEKYEYMYDENGRPQSLVHCEWNKKSNDWNPGVEHDFYMFDFNKELLTENIYKK